MYRQGERFSMDINPEYRDKLAKLGQLFEKPDKAKTMRKIIDICYDQFIK